MPMDNLVEQLGAKFKIEFAGRVAGKVANALLVVFLARELNPNGYGLLFLAISIFSVVQIFTRFGLAKSAGRFISEYKINKPDQIPFIIRRTFIYNIATIMLVATVFYFTHSQLSQILKEPGLEPLLRIGVLYIIFGSLTKFARIVYQGFDNIQISAKINALSRISQLALISILLSVGMGVNGALWGMVGGFIISSGLGLTHLFKRHYSGRKDKQVEIGLYQKIRRYSVPLAFTDLALKLDGQVDTILVGIFLNPIAVGYYSLSKQITEFVQMPASALGFSTAPLYSQQVNENNPRLAAQLFEESLFHTLLLYVPGAVGIVLTASPGIRYVFGTGYLGAVPLLQIFSVYTILLALTKLTDYPLDYLGRAKQRAVANGIASTSNIALNIVLIPMIGVTGAAISTVITHTFYVMFKLFLIKDELPVQFHTLLHDLTKVGAVSVGMGAIVWLLLPYVSGLITLSCIIVVGILSWGFLSLTTGAIDIRSISTVLRGS